MGIDDVGFLVELEKFLAYLQLNYEFNEVDNEKVSMSRIQLLTSLRNSGFTDEQLGQLISALPLL